MEVDLVRKEFMLTCLNCGQVLSLILVVARGVQDNITPFDVQMALQQRGFTDFYQRPVPLQGAGIIQPALGVCEKSLAGTGQHVFDANKAVAVE